MTDPARPILRGETEITLRRDTVRKSVARPATRMLVSDEDAPLLSALKAKRRALAEAARVPAYIIFTDRTLIEMAEKRPETLDAMAGITGVGQKKLESYGAAFLAVITGSAADVHPARRRLSGRPEGLLFDRLMQAQSDLARGMDGTGKPMSISAPLLRRIAEQRPASPAELARLLDAPKAERFGTAFLEIIAAG
jgi:ATP-dependent DNA helicase RecQ